MKKKILVLTFCLFTGLGLDATQDKDLRQLHQAAEMAIGKSDFAAAKESYQRLLEKVNPPSSFSRKYRVDWATYVDFVSRLAHIHLALGEYEEGEKLLSKLMERKIPEEFAPTIKLLQSRFHCSKQSPGEAYLLMKETTLEQSMDKWRGEDRSLYRSLEYMLNTHYDTLLQKAKRFFSAGDYVQAKEMYQDLLTAIEKGYFPKAETDGFVKKKVLCRLAEINFYLADYENTLTLIPKIDHAEDKIDRQLLYLAAMAYQEKHSYQMALDYFDSYLHSGNQSELIHYEHALFETGFAFYRSGQFSQARRYFEMLQQNGLKRGKPVFLGAIYLARIHLKEKHSRLAETILCALSHELSARDPLQYEIAYLRGKASFDAGEYASAAEFFELSFPAPPISGEWCHDSLYQMGLCYTKLGDDPLKGKKAKEMFFSKADVVFRRLLRTKEHERACLALCKLFLLRSTHFEEVTCIDAMNTLLTKEAPSFSLEGKLQALLLRAEGENDYAARNIFYQKATEEVFQDALSYALAWYYKGLNDFQEGLSKRGESEYYFEKAIASFETAFLLIGKNDRKKSAELLKWEAEANYYKNSASTALKVCDQLLNEFPLSMQEKEEILYLQGFVASHLPDEDAFATAKSSLNLVASLFPDGSFADSSLYLLGTLHYQHQEFSEAKTCFLQLAQNYPSSKWAGEGVFWAAEAAEKQGEDAFNLRKQIYEKYSHSLYAPEAYFRLFPLKVYVKGEKEALMHLKQFSVYFPNSLLNIPSFYFLGIHASSPIESEEYFKKGLLIFEEVSKQSKALDTPFIYFHYRTLLELALVYLNPSEAYNPEKALLLLQDILKDFETKDHVFTSKLKDKIAYPSLYEESEFALALGYLKMNKAKNAQEIFAKMLSHYTASGIRESYYLSRVWQEKAKLALQCEDPDTALRCFKMAEECGKEYLLIDEKLSLWIFQSECYRMQNSLDQAMKMLSQVINEDAASPLRLKAMLLRAEIYELQGRFELATKQLEAIVKKGGEWAHQAKEKLRTTYGLE